MDRRNTIQKELIFKAVLDMHRHVTSDEVYELIKSEYPSIGKGTVYRNLKLLAEENKIRRVEIPGGPDRFDYKLLKHHHLRCMKCGKVADVELDDIPELETEVRNARGLTFWDYDILFKGICPECQEKEPEKD